MHVKTRSAASADESPPRHLDRHVTREPALPPQAERRAVSAVAPPDGRSERVDLTGLSIAGITRRRVGWLAGGLLSIWIVLVFARQVGDAGAAAEKATQLAADNAALAAEVTSLQNEVDLVVRPEYIAIAARGYQLGADREIPFALGPSVAAPLDGAPGSASVRLGAHDEHQTPLESWLSMLFGRGS